MRPNLDGYPYNSTFTVTADGCNGFEVSYKRQSFHMANTIAFMLTEAFHDVKIVDDNTGEVMYNHYESAELFNARKAQSEVVREVCVILTVR